ncbi:hypothetical protein V8B97DRAFT_1870180 [Scleroderma yunnanense]
MSSILQYPPELLFIICSHVYATGIPAATSSLDPVSLGEHGIPTALPSSMPPGHWPEPVVRKTLANLCLVNHAWYEAAKPWLWRRIEVRLPRSWLALVDEIAGGEDEQSVEKAVEKSIQAIAEAAVATATMAGASTDEDVLRKWKQSILETLAGPDGSVPPEMLSPPASRDPSPRRLRTKSKSPPRWKIIRSISEAAQDIADRDEFGLYVPRAHDPRPGRFAQHIDFNHFRTIGMRRSVEEGVNSRFVTGERVEALLKEMPNLTAFGATEYMDSALTLPVLNELFLRGVSSRIPGRPSRGRGLLVTDPNGSDEDDHERRRDCREIESADFTGCVSAIFVGALTEFVNMHLSPAIGDSSGSEDESRRDERRYRSKRAVRFEEQEPLVFSGLRRLCLRGVKSIQSHVLNRFVLAFPSLTHLDLSATRVTPELLVSLGGSSIRLRSLSLARCIRLTGESIKTFMIHAPAAAQIQELTLYGDQTFPSPLSADDLDEIFTLAPCFTSGELTYLDLSSSPVTCELLEKCVPQLKLRSLGLSYIPELELDAITQFIKTKAYNVEVLTLISTSPDLEWSRRGAGFEVPRSTARQTSLSLHAKIISQLCMPPHMSVLASKSVSKQAPTRLRVMELSMPTLVSLGAGGGTWRTIRSKGGRGWYVDTASGWVNGELVRDLSHDHPLRVEMNRLADANGNVNSGIGWHARKMEVLHGSGMLGREDGLYGAVSFAYQG